MLNYFLYIQRDISRYSQPLEISKRDEQKCSVTTEFIQKEVVYSLKVQFDCEVTSDYLKLPRIQMDTSGGLGSNLSVVLPGLLSDTIPTVLKSEEISWREIWVPHNGVCREFCVMGCNAVSLVSKPLIFRTQFETWNSLYFTSHSILKYKQNKLFSMSNLSIGFNSTGYLASQ